jgi:hypothetical protein
LVDAVAIWLKCNSTPPFRLDSLLERKQEVVTPCL